VTEANPNRWSEHYSNALLREPGLRGGTALAFVLLTIPILALAGQCARLGAPARDRRLAGLRLAGATPGQATLVAVAETALASLVGSAAGLGGSLAAHAFLDPRDAQGRLLLPTDVRPSTAALAVTVFALPLVAALATAWLMRKVTVGPFGVLRRTRTRPPRPWPGAFIVIGVICIVGLSPALDWLGRRQVDVPDWTIMPTLVFGTLSAAVGLVLGTGWVSHRSGRWLHRFGRWPSALIAARRLVADPWAGSRTFAAFLTAVLFAGGAAGLRASFEVPLQMEREAEAELARITGQAAVSIGDDFYLSTMDLVDIAVVVALVIAAGGLLVAVAEGIVSRRREYASLVATGVPRAVLGRAILWQSLVPAVPTIVLALAVGAILARGGGGTEAQSSGTGMSYCDASPTICDDETAAAAFTKIVEIVPTTRPIPIPYDDLFAFGGLAIGAILAMVGIGLLFLRSSTAVEELRAT
jgi:hypothetical protein